MRSRPGAQHQSAECSIASCVVLFEAFGNVTAVGCGNQMWSLGIDTYLIPEPMGTCVEMLWFWSQNPWEINSFLAFALSRVVGKG